MDNVCYRIYTENKNRMGLENLVRNFFSCFTIIKGVGYWEGVHEDCLIIEIILPNMAYSVSDREVDRLGTSIALFNTQESVLITKQLVTIL